MIVPLWAVLSLIGACSEEHASPPSIAIRTARSADAGAKDGSARDDGAAGRGGRDAGRSPLDFGEFEVEDKPPQRTPDASVTEDGGMPSGWHCAAALALDAVCDCGCGASDPACEGLGCSVPGCSVPACGACFDAAGAQRDCSAPGLWQCEAARQSDGVCDCGCGALDPDCGEGAGCYPLGCNVNGCERCQSARGNAECEAPAKFACDEDALENGKCDCGCGNFDPECTETSGCAEPGCAVLGCELCHGGDGAPRACAAPAAACAAAVFADEVCDCGCSEIDPACGQAGCTGVGCAAAACAVCRDAFGRPTPCTSATCDASRAHDGACDCGCGAPDPDCDGAGCVEPDCEADACEVRHDEHGKAIRPAAFACGEAAFEDEPCDCGCGAADPACVQGCSEPGCRAPGCDRCRGESGEPEACRWRCDPARFGDGACDCGCGALDPDCGARGCEKPGCYADACEVCVGEAGETIACERSACPPGFQNDGVCDCGCREDDIDCSFVRDCIAPGCSESGCGRCHDAGGRVIQCADFMCALGGQGNGTGCNCGCGAPDPDCAEGLGCSVPGCVAEGCSTCQAANGAPMSCAP